MKLRSNRFSVRSRTKNSNSPSLTAPSGPAISIQSLRFGHTENPLAGPLSIDICAGTAVLIIGANGAGKSTLLRTLAGQLPVLAGAIQFDGRDIDEREVEFRRAVATVFDDGAFFSELTVIEHLRLVATAHGHPAIETAVARELEVFGLEPAADAFPLTLSSGQRRRLLLAAAFVRPAKILLLDEPEQRLDTGIRGTLIARLVAARDAGITIVAASHDRSVVAELADRVVLVGEDSSVRSVAAGLIALDTL